ncbi:MAG: HU family DNA-binding protein, partial [Muribaculaceae bacterium]|nr:HU family DNA-binding protein [Muribaculaceae bacterium]
MKTTLTLNDLSQLLTQNNPSIDKSQAEAFINSFFRNIANGLGADEHITIDGLGSFARDGENNVTFIPDSELAEKVNEPFSFFEAVELDDRFVDSDEPEPEHEPEPAPELNDEEKIVEQAETQ